MESRRRSSSGQFVPISSENGTDKSWTTRFMLPFIGTSLLLSATANSVMFKKMTNVMPNYPFFLMELSTIVYIPICLLVSGILGITGNLDESNFRFSKSKFAIVALLEGFGGLLTLFGGVYTKGTTQMLLGQASIPITMALAFLFLRTRFEWMQYLGAMVILSGVFVVLAPKMFGSSSANANERGADVVLFNLIFFLSIIPQAFANVYKEEAFRDFKKIDVFYTMLWVGFFQTVISFVFLPFNSLPFLGSQALPLNELPKALFDGAKCFVGVNSIVHNCYLYYPIHGLSPCDSCEGAWITVTIYMIINILFNVFAILMIREGSASLYIILMTLRLPLGNMMFYMSWIMGDDQQPFDPHDISGLLVILIGLVIYRYQRSPESEDADAPYIVTSVVTFKPGIGEIATTQIQRRPVQMQRSSEGIRGQLYTRLGMRPSKFYVDPEEQESEDAYSEKSLLQRTHVGVERRPVVAYGATSTPSVGFGISPIARSAPLYTALLARSAGSTMVPIDEEDDQDYTDSSSEDVDQ